MWQGQTYVMERIGFGLCVAPKLMDVIIKWATRKFPAADNYIDDVATPRDEAEAVAHALNEYGLPTKPAVDFADSNALGLKVYAEGSDVKWRRREDIDTMLPETITKREVFRWCGRLISHYPVGGWLRPMASWLKRLPAAEKTKWDAPLSQELQDLCRRIESRVTRDDPVRGVWSTLDIGEWKVWCDASNIAYGVVL